jgi:hypothetical protein
LNLLLEKNKENTGTYRPSNFLNRPPIAQQIKERIDKWFCRKLKSFCTAKETFTRLKRQTLEWRENFASYTLNKELITRIYRELKKLNSPCINNPMRKFINELNR